MVNRVWMLGMLVALAGCSRTPELASVEGVVRLDGKPLCDVEVQFIPDVTQGTTGPPGSAYTDKEGRYQIVARGKTGIVVGKNRVSIHDATIMMPGGGADPESGVAVPGAPLHARRPRVPSAYSNAAQNPLGVFEIGSGSNLLNFELKSRP